MTTYDAKGMPQFATSDKIAASGDGLREDLNLISASASAAIGAEGGRAEAAANTYTDSKVTVLNTKDSQQDTRLTGTESKNTVQDNTLAGHDSRLGALETLGGLAAGDVSDATVTDLIANPASTTASELADFITGETTVVAAPNPGGVDDTSALQAVLTAAGSSGGNRRVVGRQGTYVVSRVTVPAGVTLADIKLLHKAGSTLSAVLLSGVGSALKHVELDGNAVNQTTSVVGVEANADRVTVADCYVHDVKWDGIVVNGPCKYVNVRNNHVVTTGRYGVTINASTSAVSPLHTVIHGNTVELSANGGLGIVGTAEYATFSSNTIRQSGGDGIAAYNAANRHITAVGNTIYSSGNHGIHLGGNGVVIADNTAYDVRNGHGFFVRNNDASMLTGAVISGNAVIGVAPGCGVRAEYANEVTLTGNSVTTATDSGIDVRDCLGVTISANTVKGVTRGIQIIRSQRMAISGNTLKTSSQQGILGQDLGGTACTKIAVTGNVIDGCTDAIKSTQLSNYWMVSGNITSGVTGLAISLIGANNSTGTNLAA